MKKSFIVLIILLVILTACKIQEQTIENIPIEKEEIAKKETVEKINQTISKIEPVIAEILEKRKNVLSLEYKYYSNDSTEILMYYIKGDNAKVIIDEDVKTYVKNQTFNVVYLNYSSKTAIGVCQHKVCESLNKQNVSFSKYVKPTPFDWNIIEGKKVYDESIENKEVYVLDTNEGRVWLWTYRGIPLKAIKNNVTYEFRGLIVNSISDNDVMIG